MTDETAPAVRIPNVSPGAVSGLDNEPLMGSPADTYPDYADVEPLDAPVLPTIPEDLHTVDDLLDWVNAEPSDEDPEVETGLRAIAVLRQEGRDGRVTLVGPLEDIILGAILDAWDDEPEDKQEGETIEGEQVESDTAGTGDAINADTGEVTAPGDPLPPIEGTGGTPLDPPQPGADADGFGGDAPAPADPPAGD